MTDRLDSWKEIASHLNRQVRTVQRWEKTEKLPVHRHVHGSGGSVFAHRHELDAWLEARITPAPSVSVPEEAPPQAAGNRKARTLLLVLALFIAPVWIGTTNFLDAGGQTGLQRIVVLPFRSLGPEPVDAAMGASLLEEAIAQLAELGPERIAVIGPTSSLRLKGDQRSLSTIAEELDVDYVIEGTILHQDDHLQVKARLVRASTLDLIWTDTFELPANDPFRASAKVAHQVVRAVSHELLASTPPAPSNSSVDPRAHEAWMRGRYFFRKATRQGFLEARGQFAQAIAIEPSFVEAQVGLAHAHNLLGRYGFVPPSESFPEGKAAALRALDLEPKNAEAHASLALALFYYDWNFVEAAREFQRAIELAPELALGHHWYAHFLSAMGLHSESIREVHRAQDLEPLWALIVSDGAWFYYRARRYEEAAEESRRALMLEPESSSAASCLASSLKRLGRADQAWSELRPILVATGTLERIPDLDESDPKRALAAYWNWTQGAINRAAEDRYVAPIQHAYAASSSEDPEQVIHWLQVGLDTRDRGPLLTLAHPHFDALREDPRFQRILNAVGFPEDPRSLLPGGH